MKILYLLIIILIFSIEGIAQEKQNKPENKPNITEIQKKRFQLFELSPKFSFPNTDGLVFIDSIRPLPGQLQTSPLPGTELYAQSDMPVYRPGPEFFSGMPVMVPDSSVHYFILQKKFGVNSAEPEVKK